MKKLSLILTIIVLLGFLPMNVFAQFDFLNQMINDDKSIYELTPLDSGTTTTAEDEGISLISCDMVWSTDSYVPYEYPGRALPAVDGFVTVTAILNVSGGNAANLQYSWFIDNVFDEAQSGYGRTEFKFGIRRDAQNTHTVLVKIFNDSNTFYYEKTATIPIVEPEILIYSSIKNYLFSEEAKNLLSISNNKKTSFIARPFFFSIEKASDLNYSWRISGQEPINSTGFDSNVLELSSSQRTAQLQTTDLLLRVDNGAMFPKQNIIKDLRIQMR